MPVVHIGEFGTPSKDRAWLSAQAELAIKHLTKVCGPPPPQMELTVEWQEHESGSYPLIVLSWEDGEYGPRGAPSNYIERCEAALAAYENGGELPPGWTMPPVRSEDGDPNEPWDPDEPPPEPPEAAGFFEYQLYLNKLMLWGVESSKQKRSRPHLVERDDDKEDAS